MRSSQKMNCEGVRNCAKASLAAQSRSCAPPFRVRPLRTARREAIYRGFRGPVVEGGKTGLRSARSARSFPRRERDIDGHCSRWCGA